MKNRSHSQQQAHQVSDAQAAAGSHVKLQQVQDDFLKWLDSMEQKHPEQDRYAYKKVR